MGFADIYEFLNRCSVSPEPSLAPREKFETSLQHVLGPSAARCVAAFASGAFLRGTTLWGFGPSLRACVVLAPRRHARGGGGEGPPVEGAEKKGARPLPGSLDHLRGPSTEPRRRVVLVFQSGCDGAQHPSNVLLSACWAVDSLSHDAGGRHRAGLAPRGLGRQRGG